jgi:hypothetical protein
VTRGKNLAGHTILTHLLSREGGMCSLALLGLAVLSVLECLSCLSMPFGILCRVFLDHSLVF